MMHPVSRDIYLGINIIYSPSRCFITRRNSTSSQTSDSTPIHLNSTYAVIDGPSFWQPCIHTSSSFPVGFDNLSNADPSSVQPPQHLLEQNTDDLPLPASDLAE